MNRRNIWLAVVVLAAASALAATSAFAATGNTQVDGIQTVVTLTAIGVLLRMSAEEGAARPARSEGRGRLAFLGGLAP